jgi:tight adherence protein B
MYVFLVASLSALLVAGCYTVFSLVKQRPSTNSLKDYAQDPTKLGQRVCYVVLGYSFSFLIGWLFYQNMYVSALVGCAGLLYPGLRIKRLIQQQQEELRFQFRQALYSLSSAVSAGKAVENAFREVLDDLQLMYPDQRTAIRSEFEIIVRRIDNGETIEQALQDLALRSHVEEIVQFTDVFRTCKRTGGDLVEVIRRTSSIIGDKLETKQEISVLLAQKKFESNILLFAPMCVLALLTYMSPDYMQPLYEWGIGPVIMTVSLLLLCFAYWLSKRIMDIKL